MVKSKTARRVEIERWFRIREREGLSLRALAERSGVPVGTLSWWSHRLRQEQPGPGAFVELGMISLDAQPRETGVATESGPESCIRYPSGITVEFRGDLARSLAERFTEDLARWS